MYTEIGTLLSDRGAVAFAVDDFERLPWRCTFRGAGHYFTTSQALAGYAAGRGWILCNQINELANALDVLANGILLFDVPKEGKK